MMNRALLSSKGRIPCSRCKSTPTICYALKLAQTNTRNATSAVGIVEVQKIVSSKENAHKWKKRRFSHNSSGNQQELSSFYHVEASNAARGDVTKLTVRGPDIDGMLASMTVALAIKGCSLVELKARNLKNHVVSLHEHVGEATTSGIPQVKDVFYVVNRETGRPFQDAELRELAISLVEALKTPMNVVSVKGAMKRLEKLDENLKEHPYHSSLEQQITIIPSGTNASTD